jgi:hypothetical protein
MDFNTLRMHTKGLRLKPVATTDIRERWGYC